jgi:hypothetical protein
MTHAFVIQIAGRTAGIVARDPADHACHFFASSTTYRVLGGVAFQEPEHAERAVRKVHGGRARARPKAGKTPESYRARGCAMFAKPRHLTLIAAVKSPVPLVHPPARNDPLFAQTFGSGRRGCAAAEQSVIAEAGDACR